MCCEYRKNDEPYREKRGGREKFAPEHKFPLTFTREYDIVLFASPIATDLACPDSSVGRAED